MLVMYACHCRKPDTTSSYQQIDPIITKEDLEAFFTSCGPVACIQVRCSRGQAVNRGVAVPRRVFTSRDRQYATVEFSDSKAVQKAIKKNGSKLKGCPLVVRVQLEVITCVVHQTCSGVCFGCRPPRSPRYHDASVISLRHPNSPLQEIFPDREAKRLGVASPYSLGAGPSRCEIHSHLKMTLLKNYVDRY
jgi:RNA recognition motif-containing protein